MYVCERNLQTYAYMCAMHHSGRITNRNSSGNKNETEQNLNVVCRYVHTFVVHSYYDVLSFVIVAVSIIIVIAAKSNVLSRTTAEDSCLDWHRTC